MRIIILVAFLNILNLVFSKPIPQAPAAAGAPPGPNAGALALQMMYGLPKSGIAGFGDNMGGAFANFGNGQGSAFNAILSGVFNAIGTFISGVLGSGAINTAFLNYNNLPPPEPAPTGAPAGGAPTPAPEE